MPKVNKNSNEDVVVAVAPKDWTAAMLEGLSIKAVLKLVGEKAGPTEQLVLKKSAKRRGKASKRFALKVVKRMQKKYVESPTIPTIAPIASSSSNGKRTRSPESLEVATASTSASQDGHPSCPEESQETAPHASATIKAEDVEYIDLTVHESAGSAIVTEIEEEVKVEAEVKVTIKTEDGADAEEVEYIDLTTEIDAAPADRRNPEIYYFAGFHEPVQNMYVPRGLAHFLQFGMDHRYTVDDFEEAMFDEALFDYEEFDAQPKAPWISVTPLGRRRREHDREDDNEGVLRGAPRPRLAQLGPSAVRRTADWASMPSFPICRDREDDEGARRGAPRARWY
ncbi:hypothetical protein CYLTODRAFT_442625 [Cylindrobasidium torrendii FP15055 ss-10]|uniref:Uncharacterized protein n=1 Tax=Cylindrobasidium torrendii FP15055 ss-10 TaxID=1314674 RepID=A0A0D7BII5_9AGAR|nr:hypothetical protein CYLTODRAFT_442625 [Cylindrobasidium torrendii FP15055 ss-10]